MPERVYFLAAAVMAASPNVSVYQALELAERIVSVMDSCLEYVPRRQAIEILAGSRAA